jgi:hypothetical protein
MCAMDGRQPSSDSEAEAEQQGGGEAGGAGGGAGGHGADGRVQDERAQVYRCLDHPFSTAAREPIPYHSPLSSGLR